MSAGRGWRIVGDLHSKSAPRLLPSGYPGCACDIPSVNYQFSWKIKLWTHFYSYSPEIWSYLKGIYDENDLIEKYVKLQHQLESAVWNSEAGVWRFKVRDLKTGTVSEDEAEFFINAGGVSVLMGLTLADHLKTSLIVVLSLVGAECISISCKYKPSEGSLRHPLTAASFASRIYPGSITSKGS